MNWNNTNKSLIIGTDLPSLLTHSLQVKGSAYVGNAFDYAPSSSVVDFVVSNSTGNSRFLFGQSNTVYGGMLWKYNANTSLPRLEVLATGTRAIAFTTNSLDRMVIDSEGDLNIIGKAKIGTTFPSSANHRVQVQGSLILGDGLNYAIAGGRTDFVVSNASAQSRFFLGQSNTHYGGMIWDYNASTSLAKLIVRTN